MNETQIDYNDTTALRAALVGRRIVETRKGVVKEGWDKGMDSIEFVLDDGTILEAREADGGCACTNGCWSVEAPAEPPTSVITNVEVVDEKDSEWSESATLRMFVYAEGIPTATELIRSEGGDNGYYGWGYHVYVKAPS
jgi:hypothetical protein